MSVDLDEVCEVPLLFGITGLTRGVVSGMLPPQGSGRGMICQISLSPPPADDRGGGPVVPIYNRDEPGVFRISILMCGARKLWCSYMVESAVVLGAGSQ